MTPPAGEPGAGRRAQRDVVEVQAAVDRVLLAHGEYLPIELLLAQSRLDYEEYEAWRRGALDTLDDAIIGNPARVSAALREAAGWARRQGLEPERLHHEGWSPAAGRRLSASTDRTLCDLLETVYRRPDERSQLDLFLDGGETAALKDLRDALVAGDVPGSGEALAALARRFPGHAVCADAERLHDALASLDEPGASRGVESELDDLRARLVPAAERLLGARHRDFLAPFWRRLAARMEDLPFDPHRPEHHASWTHAQCLDWRGVRRAALAAPDHTRQAVLLGRLVDAELRLGERVSAVEHLALLCWRHGAHAESLLDAEALADTSVRLAWETFQDLELDPPIEVDWLPAVLLLHERGLARAWQAAVPAGECPPARGFEALLALVRAGKGSLDERTTELRRTLAECHPGILRLFLA